MRASEIIVEYRDAALYHGTSFGKAEEILTQNVMNATRPITLGKSMQVKGDTGMSWQYIVSFSRSLSVASAFAQDKSQEFGSSRPAGVVLVFDQALIHRDYGRRLQAYNDLQHMSRKNNTEQEEALIGNLANVAKYLTKIYVFVNSPEHLEKLQDRYKIVFAHPKTKVVMGKQRKPRAQNRLQAFPTHREIER